MTADSPNAATFGFVRSLSRHQKTAVVILVMAFAATAITPTLTVTMLAVLVALPLLFCVTMEVADGNASPVVLFWVLVFPLGYYFLSFPRKGTILTLDRAAVALMMVAVFLRPQPGKTLVPSSLGRAGWAWAAFLAAATLSLAQVTELQAPLRILVEAFFMPALLAYYVVTRFPVTRYLRLLHGLICVVGIYLALIGLMEVVRGEDLLPLEGAAEYLAGQQRGLSLLRVNGPFSTNNSFGLVGLIAFCLVWFLHRARSSDWPLWQRLLHAFGMLACLITALLPLFRSIVITIFVILLLALAWTKSIKARIAGGLVLLLLAGSFFYIVTQFPDLYEERVSSPTNFYGRLAQQVQNFNIFLEHPILGVGLNGFYQAATRAFSGTSYEGVGSVDFPHSNVGAVLAETGLLGFVPYLASQILLVIAFRKLCASRSPRLTVAWRFFLMVFLSYWISGLTLTSGYYSDLNLWYLFAVSTIYKFALEDKAESSDNRLLLHG